MTALLLCGLFGTGWGAFQLWRAYSLKRIMFGPYVSDVQPASEPISFWVSVAIHAFLLVAGVVSLVAGGAQLLRNSN
jgi:hypothetical protein